MQYLILIFCIFLISTTTFSQTYHAELFGRSKDDSEGIHLTVFRSEPEEELYLPVVDTSKAQFFKVSSNWKDVWVMVIANDDFDQLYIDTNLDKDLSNDGSPRSFSKSENDFVFEIIVDNDFERKTTIMLQRRPNLSESRLKGYVDKEGNLNANFAKFYGGIKGIFDYEGKCGTFYFNNYLTLNRGEISLAGISYQIAAVDARNNGLFNDYDSDVILVDLNQDGKLKYGDAAEHYSLKDVIWIDDTPYKVSQIEKYGRWIELSTTIEKTNPYFVMAERTIENDSTLINAYYGRIDPTIWQTTFETLYGDSTTLENYKSNYLLLSFWGEWCVGCIQEIPKLVEADDEYSKDKLQIIGMLKTHNKKNVKKMIKEKSMKWPQFLVTDKLEKQFRIFGYPRNMLFLPDKKSCIIFGHLSEKFFNKYVE